MASSSIKTCKDWYCLVDLFQSSCTSKVRHCCLRNCREVLRDHPDSRESRGLSMSSCVFGPLLLPPFRVEIDLGLGYAVIPSAIQLVRLGWRTWKLVWDIRIHDKKCWVVIDGAWARSYDHINIGKHDSDVSKTVNLLQSQLSRDQNPWSQIRLEFTSLARIYVYLLHCCKRHMPN